MEEMMREWMTRQMEANEHMKDQLVELENRINQGFRNRQAIIKKLERHFQYLEKIQQTISLPHTTYTKPRHEFVYKPPSIRNKSSRETHQLILIILEKVYRLRKALYGLKQASRAWYDELTNFLMSKGFTKGTIDPTLFTIRYGDDILLVQIYINDIIFRTSDPPIFMSFGTPLAAKPKLDADLSGTPVDQRKYQSMIGSLMYLTSSRPGIVQAVCYCARYQARPTEKHLKGVKRIFRYLKGTINMGLWYPHDSGFELTAFSDVDHAGRIETLKSTSEGIQFLGDKLINWMLKKQDCTTMSSAEAEYVALSASCAQVEHGIIELYFVRTEYQLADIFTKALPKDRLQYLVKQIGMRCLTPAELEVLANESA
ncbi:retrovirus-related pol polyprotein from transposon TNT 1-94 [Tanacetum coccineum]